MIYKMIKIQFILLWLFQIMIFYFGCLQLLVSAENDISSHNPYILKRIIRKTNETKLNSTSISGETNKSTVITGNKNLDAPSTVTQKSNVSTSKSINPIDDGKF